MQKILLVEDDPSIYQLYQRIFKLEGYEVEVAENGELGLAKLENFHPDIVLLDIMMRTMNGLEMLTNIKADPKTKDIPVIVLTNVSDTRITDLATSRGALQCIIKSETEPDDVIELVRGVLIKNAK